MNELIGIVEKKIVIYTALHNAAKELKQEDNIKFYAECIVKLNKVLKILIRFSKKSHSSLAWM